MKEYRILCAIVCLLQFSIAVLSYGIGLKRVAIERKYVDILVGVSWTITSLWWAFCGITGTGY